jgi:hypothetical protein
MTAKELKDKIAVLVGGKLAKDLPVEMGQDGAVAIRTSQAELPGDEFRRKLTDLNKREAEFKTVKEKAERMVQLAGTKEARERAELDRQNQQKIIAGIREEVKTADRALQLLKDERINLFFTECERIKAIRNAVWVKVHAEMIKSLKSQMADVIVSEQIDRDLRITCLSDQSEAFKEMKRFDGDVDSFNALAKENKMPDNSFVSQTLKMVGPYEAAFSETISRGHRNYDALTKIGNSVLAARASAASERAKQLERARQMPGWLPDKYSNLPQI